ncbi:rhombosortase [Amphritea pacifica]|uniref:rhombosortase n=1 Tax=Amphritea pacifica TaxID=2811233 RepID=UPI0019646DC0|nr:rhombosortase [Amphritea pacifica]MBN1009073.1 rhombosortase [Amphritea pacifica]
MNAVSIKQFANPKPPAQAGGSFQLPWITLALLLFCLPLSLSADLFQLGYADRSLILEGQLWRLITGHLCHTSLSHLGWDLLAFVIAAGYLELNSRSALLASLCVGVVSIDALLLSPWSAVNSYAGLSGLLFAPLVLCLFIFARKQQALNGWLPMLICLAKLIWEQFSQQALLSQSPWPPYPAAHLAGALGGMIYLGFALINPGFNLMMTPPLPRRYKSRTSLRQGFYQLCVVKRQEKADT